MRKFGFPNRLRDDSIAHPIELRTFSSARCRLSDCWDVQLHQPRGIGAAKSLRAIRPLVNAALQRLSPQFDKIYAPSGRDSIAPERLLRALLLQALFSVRSERQLMEQITYNMMFRWFVGLSMDAPVWDVTVFTKNRERLLQGDIARGFLAAILVDPHVKPLLSDEHFSVDGTLIEAWAKLAKVPPASAGGRPAEGSMKSFRPKDGSGEPPTTGRNGEVDFRGEPRTNETHASTTDADARLYKKAAGQAAKLATSGTR
jgi:transposase